MPIKGQSPKEVVHTEMHKFKYKQLHSGSNKGPLVKSRKQAIAIALSESRRAGKKYAEGGATDLPDVGDPAIGSGGEFSPGTRLGNKAADIGSKLGYGVTTNAATMPYRIMKNMVEGSQESMAGDGVGELSPKSVQGAGDLIMQGLGNAAGARPGSPAAPGVFVGPYGAHMLRDADRNLTQPHPVIGEEINQRASSLRPEFRDIYKGAAQDMRDAQARGVLGMRDQKGSNNPADSDVWAGSGWERDASGMPVKEIPDTGVRLVQVPGNLGRFTLEHPAGDLHKIYDIPPISFDPSRSGKGGYTTFSVMNGIERPKAIFLNGTPTKKNLEEQTSTALHEMQHFIGSKEGLRAGANQGYIIPGSPEYQQEFFPGHKENLPFQEGANAAIAKSDPRVIERLRKSPGRLEDARAKFQAYYNNAGEVQARNAELRRKTPSLYQIKPEDTESVTRGLQWLDPNNLPREYEKSDGGKVTARDRIDATARKLRRASGGEVKPHSINPMNDVTDPDVHPLGSAAGGPRASLHMAAKGLLPSSHVHKQDLGAGDESKVYDKGDSADDEGGAPKAGGGSTGNFNPERASAIGLTRQGMINSSVPGRTDKLNLNVPNGSYIIPADIPSALGQGNSMAGSAILNKMFNSGPYGMNLSKGHSVAPRHSSLSFSSKAHFAKGGKAGGVAPIVAAGGEYVIHPQTVAQLGNGDLNLGHDILDQFVKQVREKHISTLKSLKPPKGSK